MQDPCDRLVENVRLLGNHHLKYTRTIEAGKNRLIERLEAKGQIDQVHLWKSAHDVRREMDVILGVGQSLDEKLTLLGCYYALQFLHMNLRAKDVLAFNLTSTDDRYRVYREFMIQAGLAFHRLTAGYMERLLDLFVPREKLPEFVVCSVGTRADQDDIDLGIVDDGSDKRRQLNRAVGKLRNEMLKHAVGLDFYLSEHVGMKSYSASISEYRELLDREIHDFIIITEMLGAARLLGSDLLFERFKKQVTWRYHYDRYQDNRYHEGYLRGILGEIRSLLTRHVKPDSIHLKDDGLRMLKSMIYVAKTIFRIDKVNYWNILRELEIRDPRRRAIYHRMDRALTFLEVFRHLYQLYVVQQDEILLRDPTVPHNMAAVAQCMGYEDVGAIKAWDHLLTHYYEHVQQAREIAGTLLEYVTNHLKSTSVFSRLNLTAPKDKAGRRRPNLAIDFIRASRFFRGTKFWDDVLEALEVNNSALLRRFAADLKSLDRRSRRRLVREYGVTGSLSFYAFISFLLLLAKHQRRFECQEVFEELNAAFLEAARSTEDRIAKFTRIFDRYPRLVNDYLLALREDKIAIIEKIVGGTVWQPDVRKFQRRLKHLCRLHYQNSRYFKRFFTRVVQKHPEYVKYLENTERLRQIAKGLLGTVDSLETYAEKVSALGDYYDLEFLRVGLQTLEGVPINITDSEFTEFSDTYLQVLFEACKHYVDDEIGGTVPTRDLLAVFTTGGHAREQAYDDDYDLIIILNSTDQEMRRYCDRICTRMNAEVIKRGTLPHYRFADHFGHYVTLVDELDGLFREERDDAFIDQSQILGSRMVIGSRNFWKEFEERIVEPHIFKKRKQYIREMVGEIKSRHHDRLNLRIRDIDLKEGVGGLRDIEMILLIYKAKYGLRGPVNRKLMEVLSDIDKAHGADFKVLAEAVDFLKGVRDIYRLTVSAGDVLHPEYLGRPAEILGFRELDEEARSELLLSVYHKYAGRVAGVVRRMLGDLEG